MEDALINHTLFMVTAVCVLAITREQIVKWVIFLNLSKTTKK